MAVFDEETDAGSRRIPFRTRKYSQREPCGGNSTVKIFLGASPRPAPVPNQAVHFPYLGALVEEESWRLEARPLFQGCNCLVSADSPDRGGFMLKGAVSRAKTTKDANFQVLAV